MAKTTLPTNYVDDVLNGAMDGKRRYREIPNADGTISLEDATTYDQIGNNFGASQVNLMNDNINQSFDANKMLKTMDEVNAVTQEGYGVDALVVKELNSSLTNISNSLAWWIENGFLPDPNNQNVALIPILTSNVGSNGEAICSDYYSNDNPPYKAFDNNNSTLWVMKSQNTTSIGHIGYNFTNGAIVKKIVFNCNPNAAVNRVKRFKIQASNDGSAWVDLTDEITIADKATDTTVELKNTTRYKYYIVKIYESYIYGAGMTSLQMYGL